MFILNQSKDKLFSLENTVTKVIDNMVVLEDFSTEYHRCIGIYRDEARANEVFSRIIDSIVDFDNVYAMPFE